jgi:hypothetical protein
LYVQSTYSYAKYFEPSAGNGMLTVALPPAEVTVNEIDDIRKRNLLELGFARVMSSDATEPFLEFSQTFDGVLTNPPFGSLPYPVYEDGYEIKSLEQSMVINALKTMKDSGRCAFIVGGHNEYDSEGRVQKGKNRIFLSYLFSHFNVMDVINIDGQKLYSKMGTGFNLRVILIAGRKKLPNGFPPLLDAQLPVTAPMSNTPVQDFNDLFIRFQASM